MNFVLVQACLQYHYRHHHHHYYLFIFCKIPQIPSLISALFITLTPDVIDRQTDRHMDERMNGLICQCTDFVLVFISQESKKLPQENGEMELVEHLYASGQHKAYQNPEESQSV